MAEKRRMTPVELVDKGDGQRARRCRARERGVGGGGDHGGRGRLPGRCRARRGLTGPGGASPTGIGRGRGTRARARSSCGSRCCVLARIFRAFRSRSGAPSRRWSRSSRRLTSPTIPSYTTNRYLTRRCARAPSRAGRVLLPLALRSLRAVSACPRWCAGHRALPCRRRDASVAR